jgi:hypothetical protein
MLKARCPFADLARRLLAAVRMFQEVERVDVKLGGQLFDALEGQIAFAALQSACVGAVEAEHVGEGLLAQTTRLTDSAQILSHDPLKLAFGQELQPGRLLLDGLQTYK